MARSRCLFLFLDVISGLIKDQCVPQMGGLSPHATDISLEPGRLPIDATDAALRPLVDIPVTKRMMCASRHSFWQRDWTQGGFSIMGLLHVRFTTTKRRPRSRLRRVPVVGSSVSA